MRRVTFAVFVLGALLGTTIPALAGLTYTCNPNIDAKVAGTCAYLNSAIAGLYNSTFSNANASIYMQYGNTSLGESNTALAVLSYSAYLNALTASAQASGNAVQVAAVKALNSLDAVPYGSGNVEPSSALAAALGFPAQGLLADGTTFCGTPGTATCYNGIITITNAANDLYYRIGTEGPKQYDFYSTAEHETDEVLGTTSCIDTTGPSLSNGCAVEKMPSPRSICSVTRVREIWS